MNNVEALKSKLPTSVGFWTPQCGSCKPLSIVLEKFYRTVEGKLKIVRVNLEERAELTKQLGIRGAPTLILFYDRKAIGTKM